ncbi:ABA4-like family protein [Candidatus Leptofilum sp.]|uniref:ABA4-like family protein n=1 Tax=Candidatus Leptofilum sp. TaxID=3241576 RepID=UPI003B5C91A0
METFFKYLNTFPMPLWLAMMFAPNHSLTERASRSSSVLGIAAAHYVLAIINAVRQDQSSGSEAKLDIMSLEGVRSGLSSPQGALAGWAHMLALDLFTGAWIFRQCHRFNAPTWVRIPALAFTLMTGPFGLMIFLLWYGRSFGEALPIDA